MAEWITVGETMREARERRGLSQTDVAELLTSRGHQPVPMQTYARWEKAGHLRRELAEAATAVLPDADFIYAVRAGLDTFVTRDAVAQALEETDERVRYAIEVFEDYLGEIDLPSRPDDMDEKEPVFALSPAVYQLSLAVRADQLFLVDLDEAVRDALTKFDDILDRLDDEAARAQARRVEEARRAALNAELDLLRARLDALEAD